MSLLAVSDFKAMLEQRRDQLLEQYHVNKLSPNPSQQELSCSPDMRNREFVESRPNHQKSMSEKGFQHNLPDSPLQKSSKPVS